MHLGPVALAALASAVLTPAASASDYFGTTDQEARAYGNQQLDSNQVWLNADGGTVKGLSIPWVAACEQGSSLLDRTELEDAIPVAGDKFSVGAEYDLGAGQYQQATVDFELHAHLADGVWRGTLSIYATVDVEHGMEKQICGTGGHDIQWSADAEPAKPDLTPPDGQRDLPIAPGSVIWSRNDPTTSSRGLRWDNGFLGDRTDVGGTQDAIVDAWPSLSQRSAFVVYQRINGARRQLRLANLADEGRFGIDTTFGHGWVTDLPHGAGQPALAPGAGVGGGRVAFVSRCAIWVVSADGSRPTPLTDHAGRRGCDDRPAWAPDGRRIAFRRRFPAGGADQYLTVSTKGRRVRALPLGGAAPTSFNWAPGSKLVLLTAGAGDEPPLLQVLQEDGDLQTVSRAPGLTGRPAWSPSGHSIAVPQVQGDGTTDIVVVRAETGELLNLTTSPGVSELDPSWATPPRPPTQGAPGSRSTRLKSARTGRSRSDLDIG